IVSGRRRHTRFSRDWSSDVLFRSKFSHLNGEEYLIVHHNDLYTEIKNVIQSIDASKFKTKVSKESRKKGISLYSPIEINKAFHQIGRASCRERGEKWVAADSVSRR